MQKHVNLVDLVTSFPTNISLQNLASIQKRTNPLKFAHLVEESGKGSISSLSTKAPGAAAVHARHVDADALRALVLVPPVRNPLPRRDLEAGLVLDVCLHCPLHLGGRSLSVHMDATAPDHGVYHLAANPQHIRRLPLRHLLADPRHEHGVQPEPLPGLQIRALKFQSSSSKFRKLELANFTGLVLGCIEAKFCI